MSTRFLRARFPDGQRSRAHDSDAPAHLFEELAETGRLTEEWVIELLDYRHRVLQDRLRLTDIRLDISAAQLLALITRVGGGPPAAR